MPKRVPSLLAREGQSKGTVEAQHAALLQVKIGLHTGVVVIGEIGSSEKREVFALGETPHIAARIQGTANPDEVVMSGVTYHLVEGLFPCEDRGQPKLKGVGTPLMLYRVVNANDAHSRFVVAVRKGLTSWFGRIRGQRFSLADFNLYSHGDYVRIAESSI
jgi:class 3 adenylate cyclase